MTFRVGMYEVRDHIGSVTINLFFAGMMEMNLLQRIDFVTDRESAALERKLLRHPFQCS